ncbi:hypothetical protein AKO1_007563 [Acrasis kona]|uniref:Uncharacterized protein n=1 Tax=Acrasis kona TaxID=1008807 RepID=A0AAW2YHN0_9EUKA
MYLPTVSFFIIYWATAILHMVMDRTPQITLWSRYKVIQQEQISDIEMLPTVILNQIQLVACYCTIHSILVGRGYDTSDVSFIRIYF